MGRLPATVTSTSCPIRPSGQQRGLTLGVAVWSLWVWASGLRFEVEAELLCEGALVRRAVRFRSVAFPAIRLRRQDLNLSDHGSAASALNAMCYPTRASGSPSAGGDLSCNGNGGSKRRRPTRWLLLYALEPEALVRRPRRHRRLVRRLTTRGPQSRAFGDGSATGASSARRGRT